MKLLKRIYSIYVILVFILLFFLLFPWLILFAYRTSWHQYALYLNHIWAWVFFRLSFLRYHIEWQFKPDKDQQYILCANHFSYLDIPAMGLIPISFKFVGKSSLTSIPLFGFMYRRIHITVNRSSLMSIKESFIKSKLALDQGFNMAFFPEGGMITTDPPKMVPLKEGAFALSVEKRIPIIPVVFPDNYQILPDDNRFLFHHKTCRIIICPPIYPQKKNDAEINGIREKTRVCIQEELDKFR